jgi:nucleotide-binding universal stress UspA family protein
LHDTGFGADENSYDQRASYGKGLVTFVADKIRQAVPGSSIEEVVLDGIPVQVLLSEAAEWPADLLVVGSHGRSPAATWFLGSVSLPLLSQASCAVMIVRKAMAEASK